MTILKSQLQTGSDSFKANAQALRASVAELQERIAKIAEGGSASARAKHIGRDKLLVRDRIGSLLDPGSPFLELA
ncbi:MAG: methylcrotonoyl-CoA carboxylase, partial [Dokdonella sp.]